MKLGKYTKKIVVFVVLCGVSLCVLIYIRTSNNTKIELLPTDQQIAQVGFSGIYPPATENYTFEETGFRYNPTEEFLVMTLRYEPARTKVVFSEQRVPSDMDEDNFKMLVQDMNQYGSFNSQYGKVYLTKPTDQNGRQTAVLKTESLLVFIRADDDMSDELWRQLIDSCQYGN